MNKLLISITFIIIFAAMSISCAKKSQETVQNGSGQNQQSNQDQQGEMVLSDLFQTKYQDPKLKPAIMVDPIDYNVVNVLIRHSNVKSKLVLQEGNIVKEEKVNITKDYCVFNFTTINLLEKNSVIVFDQYSEAKDIVVLKSSEMPLVMTCTKAEIGTNFKLKNLQNIFQGTAEVMPAITVN